MRKRIQNETQTRTPQTQRGTHANARDAEVVVVAGVCQRDIKTKLTESAQLLSNWKARARFEQKKSNSATAKATAKTTSIAISIATKEEQAKTGWKIRD